MTGDLETLAREEQLRFAPAAGSFDVAAIEAAIAGMGASFRDPADASVFLLVPDEESRSYFEARRRDDPQARYPYVPTVRVGAHEVVVSPMIGHPQLRALTLDFLTWLTSNTDCRRVQDVEEDVEPDEDEQI